MSHRTDPRRGRLPGVASLALAAVLIVSACGPAIPPTSSSPSSATSSSSASAPSASAPSASADPADAAVYDKVEQQVVAIRGLKPKRPVERQFITEAEHGVILKARLPVAGKTMFALS